MLITQCQNHTTLGWWIGKRPNSFSHLLVRSKQIVTSVIYLDIICVGMSFLIDDYFLVISCSQRVKFENNKTSWLFKKCCWTKVHFVEPLICPLFCVILPMGFKASWFFRLHSYQQRKAGWDMNPGRSLDEQACFPLSQILYSIMLYWTQFVLILLSILKCMITI